MRLTLSLLLVLAFVPGCDLADTTASTPSHLITLDAGRAVSGDIYFHLDPLEIGEELTVATLVGDDRLTLHAVREVDGYALGLDTGRLHPGDVTVTYLSQGRLVTQPVAVDDDDLFEAGTTKDEPTSQHWQYINGEWVLVADFVQTETGSTELMTATGEVIEVTHVVFTLGDLDIPPPRSVEFEAPRPVTIQSQRFGEPEETFAVLR